MDVRVSIICKTAVLSKENQQGFAIAGSAKPANCQQSRQHDFGCLRPSGHLQYNVVLACKHIWHAMLYLPSPLRVYPARESLMQALENTIWPLRAGTFGLGFQERCMRSSENIWALENTAHERVLANKIGIRANRANSSLRKCVWGWQHHVSFIETNMVAQEHCIR